MLKMINVENADELCPIIEQKMYERFPLYKKTSFYYAGPLGDNFADYGTYEPCDDDTTRTIEYAIIDPDAENEVIGCFGYEIDIYGNCVYRFHAVSFRPSMIVVNDVLKELEFLIQRFKTVEWSVTSGNKVEKFYTEFCKKHGGSILIRSNACRDIDGSFHDDILYQISRDGGVPKC